MSSKLKMSTGGLKRPYYPLKRSFPALRIYIYKFVLPYHPGGEHVLLESLLADPVWNRLRNPEVELLNLPGELSLPYRLFEGPVKYKLSVVNRDEKYRKGSIFSLAKRYGRTPVAINQYMIYCLCFARVLERIFSRDNMVSLFFRSRFPSPPGVDSSLFTTLSLYFTGPSKSLYGSESSPGRFRSSTSGFLSLFHTGSASSDSRRTCSPPG